jgi:metallophosphoesterase (TIGR00282 family)
VDLVIANAENASGGVGLNPNCAEELRAAGVDIITLGDHSWQHKEMRDFLSRDDTGWCIRPANYPAGVPGKGVTVWKHTDGAEVGVMNLLGRVFLSGLLDCPFKAADQIIISELAACAVRICDFHAEATSEKLALGHMLDGRVSLIFGTHTHVQTADERISMQGTGIISDLGMCGPSDGVIGMDSEVALKRFISGLPHAYKLAKGRPVVQGLEAVIDISSGKCLELRRIREALE